MRSSKAFAILFAIFPIIIIPFLEYKLSRISLSLIIQIVIALILRSQTNYRLTSEVLEALLLWKNIVFKLNYKVYFGLKVLVESVKLWRKLIRNL
jgi:hypothetical protein